MTRDIKLIACGPNVTIVTMVIDSPQRELLACEIMIVMKEHNVKYIWLSLVLPFKISKINLHVGTQRNSGPEGGS